MRSPSCSGSHVCAHRTWRLSVPKLAARWFFWNKKPWRAFSGAASRTDRFDVTAGLAGKPRHPARRIEVREENGQHPWFERPRQGLRIDNDAVALAVYAGHY